ncbi:excinuclease ABC subunit C [Glaciihabitans tibetensis]|uniref:UvrABC system protein C n=1 Tax=Glaciihabitans tibetensis TaxID=1266600 RepID=A0A2T0VJX9_9MICO|nr:excinuclease ABC subunit UvrC [Glaciihabitans tibetensis]PRY70425.1 excinuclease ABC subunit C [Glaciihabitans tibetensis]
MADTVSYRPSAGEIPTSPGVYRFRDDSGRVLYVGKAKNLRARLANYFAPLATLHERTRRMVLAASSVSWTVVGTEFEALQLEFTWIKEFNPPFNVQFRDDKSYPYLAVTLRDEVPRVLVTRNRNLKGARYFGPYTKVWAIKDTVDVMLKVFPMRSCSDATYKRAAQTGRPCLLGDIGKCAAPCVGRVSKEEHKSIALDFASFMAGNDRSYTASITKKMQGAAAEFDYESAARYRDQLGAMDTALSKSAVVLADGIDADIFGIAHDELAAAVQQFIVRGGRIRGVRSWVVDKELDVDLPELVEIVLQNAYEDGMLPPREILVPVLPEDHAELEELLTGVRGAAPGHAGISNGLAEIDDVEDGDEQVDVLSAGPSADRGNVDRRGNFVPGTDVRGVDIDGPPRRSGGRVSVRVAQRGDKAALAQTVATNAKNALMLYKTRRSGDFVARSQALADIQEALGMSEAPLRMECYDVSHLSGTNIVASMVVFEDGLPRKDQYRRFSIADSTDDTESIYQTLSRRLAHLELDTAKVEGAPAEPDATKRLGTPPETGVGGEALLSAHADVGVVTEPAPRPRFAYRPNLLIVDGGQPQVAAAQRALDDAGVTGIALCGIAKRLEEIWLPDSDFPVILPRNSDALFLFQRIRDEAHRFAITYQRQRRSSDITSSLADIPGLGPARVRELLRHFGSVTRLRAAKVENIAEVKGVGERLANQIYESLRS